MFFIKRLKIYQLHNDNSHKREVRKYDFQLNILINLLVMPL